MFPSASAASACAISSKVSTVSGSSSSKSKSSANRMTGAFGQRFAPDPGYVDVDTRVSRESYEAARMAAGAVILAVRRDGRVVRRKRAGKGRQGKGREGKGRGEFYFFIITVAFQLNQWKVLYPHRHF